VQPIADPHVLVQMSRHRSPGHALDRDGEDVRAEGRRGDRIAALEAELGDAHRHVLTRREVDGGHPSRPQLEGLHVVGHLGDAGDLDGAGEQFRVELRFGEHGPSDQRAAVDRRGEQR
jgi:hypothetical protein